MLADAVRSSQSVSVVIPHYGNPEMTQRLVRSLASQRGAVDLEMIVSDDASPTPYPADDLALVIRSETNRGFGAAVNLGATRARGPWLLILNSDIEVSPGFVVELLSNAQRWQPATCGVRQWNPLLGHYTPSARRFPTVLSTAVLHSGALSRFRNRQWWMRLARPADAETEVSGQVDWLEGSAMLLPLIKFREVGGFDERFFLYSEEVDLQRRLQGRGVPSVLLANLEVVHRAGGSSSHVDKQVEMLRSRFLYEGKWNGKRSADRLHLLLRLGIAIDECANVGRRLTHRPFDSPEAFSRRRQVLTAASTGPPSFSR